MALIKIKPVTPGQRHMMRSDFVEVTTGNNPEKSLLAPQKQSGGRNHTGKMTMRYRGGGHKKRYRIIDFKRDKDGIPAKVDSIQYDPNRTANIALLIYADGEKRYIIAPELLTVGMTVLSGPTAEPLVGNCKLLREIPPGTFIHNIEIVPGKGAALVRSAGSNAQIQGKEGKYVSIKLPSGESRLILGSCKATIGTIGNQALFNMDLGKAGRNRWMGRRPRVRGVAMNPVDHPMGGGEGRASGGHPRSRKGIPAKGYKTRNKKKNSNRLIISRRKKG